MAMQPEELSAKQVQILPGSRKFHRNGKQLPIDLLSFWQWSSSDLLSNALRGVLAEYLVACDLGVTEQARVEWEPYDLLMKSGHKVEVKSAAYLQSWRQSKATDVCFNIALTYEWNAKTGKYGDIQKRHADVYVFCLLDHEDKTNVDPMDLEQWRFFVISTQTLNERVGQQKSISLISLMKLGPEEVRYGQISDAIRRVLNK